MTASTFDTLTAARALKAAGIEADQAEAIAAQLRTAAEADRGELVTRGDFAELAKRAELVTRGDFAELAKRAELVTRGELYRALWIQGAGIVAILTALRFLPI